MSVDPTYGFITPPERAAHRRKYGPHPKPNVIELPQHLRHLVQDRFGYPIPYVSDSTACGQASGGEWADLPGHPDWGQWQPHGDADWDKGTPLPAMLNPTRQIRCVNERLCGVCGRKVSPKSILVLIGNESLIRDGFREPGVHRACARYALRACPGINHGRIAVVESRSPRIEPRWHDSERIRDDGPYGLVPLVGGFAQMPLFELWQFPLESDLAWDAPSYLAEMGIEPHPQACPYPIPQPKGREAQDAWKRLDGEQ